MAQQAPAAAIDPSQRQRHHYTEATTLGSGTFGTVIRAKAENGDYVAIKKVLQDPRFKNRELHIMKSVSHPNVVALRDHYYTPGDVNPSDVYLNVVMEYMPETLHRCCRDWMKTTRQPVPIVLVKVFMFQLLRSIAYLHLPSVNVCHRDIKPHNLLVDSARGLLKICDFGSAKNLVPSEPNVAYICSRYYRAPELIFGTAQYTTAIDIWSVGCIFAEMLLGEPIFKGENSMGQLVEIIKVLGTPTKEQVDAMTKRCDVKLPQLRPRPWRQVFKDHVPPEAFDLCDKLLKYVPGERVLPLEGICHEFFRDLWNPTTMLPNGQPLPATLFQFSADEIASMTETQRQKLVNRVW